jgi:aspartate 1-decarboxylase
VIIISYAEYESSELEGFQPRIVFVDGENRIAKARIRREK